MTIEDSLRTTLSITVNGVLRNDVVDARVLLVHYLRDQLGLTGTHIGCDTSQCGACTVLLDDVAVKSCTMFAAQASGHTVTTIEGLGGSEGTHPVQRAFHVEHGLQCGYCTPGFVMATTSLLRREPNPSPEEIRCGLEGNICRCTGYVNIVRAVRTAAAEMRAAPTDRIGDAMVGPTGGDA